MVLACCTTLPWAQASEPDSGWFARAQDVSWSDGLPVRDLNGNWRQGYAPSEANPRALRATEVQLGWRSAWGDFGWVERKEAFLQLSADTAALLAQYQQKASSSAPTTDRSAQARFLSWHGRGFGWHSKSLAIQNTEVHWTVQGFRLLALRQFDTDGTWGSDGQGTERYAVQAHDADSRATVPEGVTALRAPGASGWAWSVSMGLTHRLNEAHRLRFNAADVASQLRWSDVVGQQESLNSQVTTRNSAGYIDYRPAVTGQYASTDVLAKIPTAWSGQWLWQVNADWETSITWSERFGMQQRWVKADYRHAGIRWGVGMEPVRQGKQIGLGHGPWQASLAWDQPHASTGRWLSWGLAFALPID